MARRKQPKPQSGNAAPVKPSKKFSAVFINLSLLAIALLAATIVYWPVRSAGWFYDDQDYIVHDPRLDHIELFLPGHWHDPPPPLDVQGISIEQMPGYGKPVIYDRYVWRLSFAIERYIFGAGDTAAVAHTINLLLHLLCICTLFLALNGLIQLYAEMTDFSILDELALSQRNLWPLLPGISAFIFSIHPWAAEPVCYVTARSGSLGTLFVLLCAYLTAAMLSRNTKRIHWFWQIPLLLFCALAAFGSKENFISAIPSCFLITAPILWLRFREVSRSRIFGVAAGTAVILAIALWIAIRSSDRAEGLFEQSSIARSWPYFFKIQNPLVMMTFLDQLPVRRISMEFNHPGWSDAACCIALLVNTALIIAGMIAGIRRPVLLAIVWFYLNLLPTNSFLIRQDFLASRNVYLPVCGIAVLFAGALIWLVENLIRERPGIPAGRNRHLATIITIVSFGVWVYWANVTTVWAIAFTTPERVWAQSAKIAPDHSTVRINLGIGLLNPASALADSPNQTTEVERELNAALAAESSPTMQYHNPSHRATRRAVAFRVLGMLRRSAGKQEEAENYFRDAWRSKPAIIGAWVDWVDVALETNDIASLRLAVNEGLTQWPNAWWPLAVRGMLRAMEERSPKLSPDTINDLLAADKADDAQPQELRMLHIRALYGMAQTENMRDRKQAFKTRLKKLGLPEKDLEALK